MVHNTADSRKKKKNGRSRTSGSDDRTACVASILRLFTRRCSPKDRIVEGRKQRRFASGFTPRRCCSCPRALGRRREGGGRIGANHLRFASRAQTVGAEEYAAALREQWPHGTRESATLFRLSLRCQWKIRVGGDEQARQRHAVACGWEFSGVP